jgi:hypothetical protein
MPVEMEDRLAAALADVHHDAVVLEPRGLRRLGDELEHPFRLVGRKLGDLAERVDVPLRDYEQMGLRLRIDVANGDEALGRIDVVAFAGEPAEETVLRQRGSLPP